MNVQQTTFERALIFAVNAHKGQKRKGDGRPYILHPLAVMEILYEVKKSKNMLLLATAAILHDVVEDCKVSLKTISSNFGYQVASIVDELTNSKKLLKEMGKTNYLCLKMAGMSNYALTIKLCDRYHNIKDRETLDDYIESTRIILKHLIENRKLSNTHTVLIRKLWAKIYKLDAEKRERDTAKVVLRPAHSSNISTKATKSIRSRKRVSKTR